MHAYALIRDPEGHVHELVHGDIVGRVWSAALQLDDGRVSEAHAMLSLREGQLQLIALRGRLAVEGQPQAHVAIRPGLRVQLARGVELEVLEVSLPDHVLGVEGPTLPRQALGAGRPPRPALRGLAGGRAIAHMDHRRALDGAKARRGRRPAAGR